MRDFFLALFYIKNLDLFGYILINNLTKTLLIALKYTQMRSRHLNHSTKHN